jgi:hypothetical protein
VDAYLNEKRLSCYCYLDITLVFSYAFLELVNCFMPTGRGKNASQHRGGFFMIFSVVGRLVSAEFPRNHFTHVFVDECGKVIP